jgi:two-component system, NtrC family, response regulator HydG
MTKLLIVDDDPDVLLAARLLLKRHFGQVDIEKNPERLPFLISTGHYDAVLLDMNFSRDVNSGKEGFDWLDRILDIDPTLTVVLFTAYGDVEMAVRAIKAGATDFVLKPWENEKMVATLTGAVKKGAGEGEKRRKENTQRSLSSSSTLFSPSSPLSPMRQILETVSRVAPTDANVLILGENGTGKDLVAREIHRQSTRQGEPFVAVDLGALSESLFESELFGHVKGAFTDARDDRAGRFEEARGGTIFLDEIGNITLPQQARLLSVLQQRTVTRVGSNRAVPIDVRLICATNANIHERVQQQNGPTLRFRQDLLYRINTIELSLPALRDRPDDLPFLANHFLQRYSQQHNRTITGISPALLTQWQQYAWPGNVRELQHTIERAVILSRGNILDPEDWHQPGKSASALTPIQETLQLEDMEKQLIQKALQQNNGNITDVARMLGLSRQALYRRMEKYGL